MSQDVIKTESPLADSAGSNETLEYQRAISDGFRATGISPNANGKTRKLYCFSCHRLENHYNGLKGKSYHYLLIGMTFGLMALFGPYRCRCCGHRRLARYNFLNLRYHYHVWKYSGKSSAAKALTLPSSLKTTDSTKNGALKEDGNGNEGEQTRPKRKKRRLKSVPIVSSIGQERREREAAQSTEQLTSPPSMDFSIEGLITSFETEESRKQKAREAAKEAAKNPFIAKKATPRKKVKGKPKRRFARKQRLTGPNIYCFGCKQNNEHYHNFKGTPYYFFFFGITFGLIPILGPFRCSVCSRKRLFIFNLLNPKYYVRHIIERTGEGYG